MDYTEQLMAFGLTRQEAVVYWALLTEGPLTGYEVAKSTGISRSNGYTSLANLVEKGAAYLEEGTVQRYHPRNLDEYCESKIAQWRVYQKQLQKVVPEPKKKGEGYLTIKGEPQILDKMKTMIREAEQRIYLSISESVFYKVRDELENAILRGIKTVLILDQRILLPGAIQYVGKQSSQTIRLIVDSENVLTGDVEDGIHSTCLYSRKKNLIELMKDSLRNEIKLLELQERKEQT